MGSRFVGTRLFAALSVLGLGAGLASGPIAGSGAANAASGSSTAPTVSVFTLPLTKVGQVNLTKLAESEPPAHVASTRQGAAVHKAAATASYREVDNAILAHASVAKPATIPNPATTPLTTNNVAGERGFSGLGGVQQADTKGGGDLEPPDQGLCAGGGYVMEFINNAISIYNSNGAQLVAPIGSPTAFRQPTSDFFSDPRCYYDAPTQRWFFQEFIVGTVSSSGTEVTPSIEFEAVSNTPDPTSTYTVWSWDTTDAATKHCPCLGDYDNLGADDNGIYVATDEFSISSSAYNGVILYAISKEQLEVAAQTGIAPPVFGYRITKDAFGKPYIVAPTSTPPGAMFATNTEYFVESNANAPGDDHLLVYALHNTSDLGTPSAPTLYSTELTTEPYAFPDDAPQKPGPRPLGKSYQDPEGGIQTDFDSEMEPTYVDGNIYGQLDTLTKSGYDAIAWYIIAPRLSGSTLSATLLHQGYVAVSSVTLMYPYTALDSSGVGYLLFSLSGPDNYPSPGYIAYGPTGPTGSVIVATPGAAPEDGFTCYAAFVGPHYGGCRWGDYSMGVAMGGRIYMGAEMIPQGYRDTLTNWGTYIWSAPPPAS